jgi:hypothetical protein
MTQRINPWNSWNSERMFMQVVDRLHLNREVRCGLCNGTGRGPCRFCDGAGSYGG